MKKVIAAMSVAAVAATAIALQAEDPKKPYEEFDYQLRHLALDKALPSLEGCISTVSNISIEDMQQDELLRINAQLVDICDIQAKNVVTIGLNVKEYLEATELTESHYKSLYEKNLKVAGLLVKYAEANPFN